MSEKVTKLTIRVNNLEHEISKLIGQIIKDKEKSEILFIEQNEVNKSNLILISKITALLNDTSLNFKCMTGIMDKLESKCYDCDKLGDGFICPTHTIKMCKEQEEKKNQPLITETQKGEKVCTKCNDVYTHSLDGICGFCQNNIWRAKVLRDNRRG